MSKKKRKKRSENCGFTMIELIASLVILAIIGVVAGAGLVTFIKGYVFTKENAKGVQKGQIALARIVKELSATDSIQAGSSTSITFDSKASPEQQRQLSWDNINQIIKIESDDLLDNVTAFNLAYYNYYDDFAPSASYSPASTTVVQITIGLKVAEGVIKTFVDRVYLSRVITGI